MHNIKLAYDLQNDTVIKCGSTHATSLTVKNFDKYARALYFPEQKTLYFRFWNPSGEYWYLTPEDEERSFKACEKALDGLIKGKIIPKRVKVLFWDTNEEIKKSDVIY
jgi:hypothetical protein